MGDVRSKLDDLIRVGSCQFNGCYKNKNKNNFNLHQT